VCYGVLCLVKKSCVVLCHAGSAPQALQGARTGSPSPGAGPSSSTQRTRSRNASTRHRSAMREARAITRSQFGRRRPSSDPGARGMAPPGSRDGTPASPPAQTRCPALRPPSCHPFGCVVSFVPLSFRNGPVHFISHVAVKRRSLNTGVRTAHVRSGSAAPVSKSQTGALKALWSHNLDLELR